MSTRTRFLSSATALLLSVALNCACAGTYYVSLTGDDKNRGTEVESAWRTVAAAAVRARAGDTVFIKAGNYGPENFEIRNSGTDGKPITFEGYCEKPGDRPFPDYKPGDDLDAAVMPVLDGGGEAPRSIYLRGKHHIRFRHLGIKRYQDLGILALDCSHVAFENLVATDFYKKEGYTYAVGIYIIGGEHNSVRDCVVTNGSGNNIAALHSNYTVIENCRTYGTVEDRIKRPDYYIVIGDCHDCVIRNCLAHNFHPNNGCGHGIGIKDQYKKGAGYRYPHSTNNKVIDCRVINSGEHLYVAHEAHHNEFVNCQALSDWRNVEQRWHQGLGVREGAHHNTFRNCLVAGVRFGAAFSDSVEGPTRFDGSSIPQTSHSNSFENCTFVDSQVGFEMWNTRHNLFKNCVVSGIDTTLFEVWYDTTGYNLFSNTIITGVRGSYAKSHSGKTPDIRFTFCDFWRNGFEKPATGLAFELDPLFADAEARDFHLRSEHGRWSAAASAWVKDAVTSPCIDAGDPRDTCEREPEPNGGRVNMGAYGNTAEASKSRPGPGPRKGGVGVPSDPMLRFQEVLCGPAPEKYSMEGKGVLRTAAFTFLPYGPGAHPATVVLKKGAELHEVTVASQSGGPAKGWLAVDASALCWPCTVTSPDGKRHEAKPLGPYLVFCVAEAAGTWHVAGLPKEGKLRVQGAFTCKMFSIKFAKGLNAELTYKHLPESKVYRFESREPDAEDEGVLTVKVGPKRKALMVEEDGEPIDRFERRGLYLQIRGVRPNVTYKIRKLDAAVVPGG